MAEGEMQPVVNPAEPKDIVGYVREASDAEVQQALTSAINNAPIWFATPPQERAAILGARRGADGKPNADPDGDPGARGG
ncbi:proline dehydrogenase/delta-1-pyrroline-5-carboxylate dehydrogenase [Klebsiella pneumoniae subsp. ozaenae]|uniref:Proline dehydrogenase/delta-1-pyrroline-5-carboxylate dehydrogenase n=1 Tax=Klebsiella pneumoniae subsp. ozaenae TaxID=574 RepID=A0A378BJA0_KLEPO|nr:proline dehydrogenase/delta-1-pyrroline-5-carboxylate dehydrogenase [Klebsiella pneumoniae subsp. ozaenae]